MSKDIGQNIQRMKKGYFTRLAGFATVGLATVVTIGIASFAGSIVDLNAGTQTTISCGDIVFGAAKQTSSTGLSSFGSTYFTSSNSIIGVSSASLSGSVYATAYSGTVSDYTSNTGVKLGKSGEAGSLTFTFSSSVLISKVIVYAMCSSTNTSASAPFTVTTSAHGSIETLTCTTSYTKTGGDPFEFAQFASDTALSTTFTIANTGTASSNTLNLCKIVFAVSTTTETSDSSAASTSSPSSSVSSSSSSSSQAATLSSISASGMNKTTYTAGQTLDTTGLIVTATYSNGSSSAVTGYTTDPVDGTALTTANTSMTISYTEGSVTKTASVTLTVTSASSGSQLMDIAVIVDESKVGKKIFLGNIVTYIDKTDNESHTVKIVGTVEADPMAEPYPLISNESALGKALMGEIPGKVVNVASEEPYEIEIVKAELAR